jgi:signal transduction histidine kinase
VVRDAHNAFAYVVTVARDITERRERELQLRLHQKLESMGLLAAGIAHEINTPSQYISDNARFLAESFRQIQRVLDAQQAVIRAAQEKGLLVEEVAAAETVAREMEVEYLRTEIPRTLTQSLEGLDRVTKIVCALKEFSHPGSPLRTPVDINRALENAVLVCRHEWKYVADVATEFDPALPLVPCLTDEFNQAILNLVINAAQAIAEARPPGSSAKGRITLRTRVEDSSAVIQIVDTGAGIPEAIRDRIFEPFFTTKPLGKGTGQGLAIVRAVVVGKHQGTIDFTSEVGKGTTFTVRLPLKVPEETSRQAAA